MTYLIIYAQKRVTVKLGDGAEETFGTAAIDETTEASSQDLKDVYSLMTHPTKIRQHQRRGYRSGASSTSASPVHSES